MRSTYIRPGHLSYVSNAASLRPPTGKAMVLPAGSSSGSGVEAPRAVFPTLPAGSRRARRQQWRGLRSYGFACDAPRAVFPMIAG